jgi:hypothetical protein
MKKLILVSILLASGASLASAANVFVDPGFENPGTITFDGAPFLGTWEGFNGGGATAGATTTLPRSGASALTLTITATPNTFAGVFQDAAVIAGTEYNFSGFHASTSTPLSLVVEARIEWRNASAEVSRTPNSTPVPGTSYTPFSLTATAPAGATFARVVYAVQSFATSPNGNGVVHVDDVSFSAVPEPSSLGLLAVGAMALGRRRRQA